MRTKRETVKNLTLRVLSWTVTKEKKWLIIRNWKGQEIACSMGGSVREAVRQSFLDYLNSNGLGPAAIKSVLSASATEAEIKRIRKWLWL